MINNTRGLSSVGRAPTLGLATLHNGTENEVVTIKCLVLGIKHCHCANHGDEIDSKYQQTAWNIRRKFRN